MIFLQLIPDSEELRIKRTKKINILNIRWPVLIFVNIRQFLKILIFVICAYSFYEEDDLCMDISRICIIHQTTGGPNGRKLKISSQQMLDEYGGHGNKSYGAVI